MGKTVEQLTTSGDTLDKYFPQLRQLILAAASDHETFQDDFRIDPDDELPALDSVGNRSVIMRPGSESYGNQLRLGGTRSVYTVSGNGESLIGFAVQARVQILDFPSSLIVSKKRRGPGGRRNPRAKTVSSVDTKQPGISRVCILRWRVTEAAAGMYMHQVESPVDEAKASEGLSVEQQPTGPAHAYPRMEQQASRPRTTTADNLLQSILETAEHGARGEAGSNGGDRRGNAPQGRAIMPGLSLEQEEELDLPIARAGSDNREDAYTTAMEQSSTMVSTMHETKDGSADAMQKIIVGTHEEDIGPIGGLRDSAFRPPLASNPSTESIHSFATDHIVDKLMADDDTRKPRPPKVDGPDAGPVKDKGVRWDEGSVMKGNRSVDTGGTGSTASSGLSVLRSHLDGTQRRIMEPALKALRNTVILVLTLASLLAVGSAVMNSFTLSAVNESLDGVELSGDRLYYAADTALHVQELLWMWAGDIEATDEQFANSQADLESVASKLERTHKYLYLNASDEEVGFESKLSFFSYLTCDSFSTN